MPVKKGTSSSLSLKRMRRCGGASQSKEG